MAERKKISLGIQSFSKLIEKGYIYVDKTEYIYDLVSKNDYYFLSRPRRFGKSLLISTFAELFSGNKKLFKGTFIEQTNFDWKKRAVIELDLSTVSAESAEDLKYNLLRKLERIADNNGIDVSKDTSIELRTVALVEGLASHHKVVILIDEYDHPLLNTIEVPAEFEKCRFILRSFFTTLKNLDRHIDFVFITGITKVSKTSIFSGLNNLKDITLDPRSAKLLGYTSEEIAANFKPYLLELSKASNKSIEDSIEEIRYWYNGYQFAHATPIYPENSLKVYNPFSVLNCLADGTFLNYWFETATPTFLMHLMKSQNYSIFDVEGAEVHIDETKAYDFDQIQLIPLLWQTGYLTIESYEERTKNYKLRYPNAEVQASFLKYFLHYMTGTKGAVVSDYSIKLKDTLKENNLDSFFRILQTFFADIPYVIHITNEKYYQSIFYIILNMVGLKVQLEVVTNDGRIDAVLETANTIYILEFKIDHSAATALKQIEDKNYHQKYLLTPKKIYLVGASFDSQKRNLTEWLVKELDTEHVIA